MSRWGAPTQTFVRREAEAMAESGADVRVLSLKRPRPTPLGIPVVHLSPAAVVTGTLRALVHHPRAVLGAFAHVLGRSSFRNVPRQAVACATGLAWGARGLADADLLHAHFGWVAATATWAATRISGTPYSVVVHAFELHTRRRVDRFTPVPLAGASARFAISSRDVGMLRDRWGLEADILRMGVSERWLEPPLPVTARDPWRIVSVGSLVAKKGHADLVEAVGRADPRWKLVIVGDGPDRRMLDRLIAQQGLASRVRLVGERPETEVRSLVGRAAVFALACVETADGNRDGIPVALMEAMATGTPVVSTRAGAIDELVEGAGLLVAPGDPQALAKALDSCRDGKRRVDLARRGRARVAGEYRSSAGARRVLERTRVQVPA